MVCPVCLQGYLCNECLQDPDVDIEFSQPGFSRICPMCQRPDLGWSDESMRTALRKHSAPDFTDDEDKS